MRRVWLMAGGLAAIVVAGSSSLAAASGAGLSASSLLDQLSWLRSAQYEPGMMALLGSGVVGLVRMARHRRERVEIS